MYYKCGNQVERTKLYNLQRCTKISVVFYFKKITFVRTRNKIKIGYKDKCGRFHAFQKESFHYSGKLRP